MKVLEIVSTVGPSRRGNATVVEMVLQAEGEESTSLAAMAERLAGRLPEITANLGLNIDPDLWRDPAKESLPAEQFGRIICRLALKLQNAAGHRLEFEDFLTDTDPKTGEARYRLIFQHDDIPIGEQAGDLAMCIAAELCPELQWTPLLRDRQQSLQESVREFIEAARPFVTPPETFSLLKAARDRGIPSLRLERQPYGAVPAEFRVAPNGMIMLGHTRHRVLMDGLYCIDRPGPGFSIMQDRKALWQLMARLEVPIITDDVNTSQAENVEQALQVMEILEYPVRIQPVARDPNAVDGWLLNDEAGLRAFFEQPENQQRIFILEPEPEGQTMDLLFAGGKPISAIQDGKPTTPDQDLVQCAVRIERAINAGFLHIRLKILPADEYGDGSFIVTNLDLSPPVCRLLKDHPQWQERAFAHFLDWLYPSDAPCRIPIAAITGTNGKTTTSTMLSRMAREEGLFVGMARTTGVYFDQELKEFGDLSGFLGHCMVFENPRVELAILETARGDVLRSGFAYDYSDVAVCTNVTADHLGEHGVETVEDMAVVKRSVLERSKGAVVLNGDDPNCLEMLPFLASPNIYLSSFQIDLGSLLNHPAIPEKALAHVINLQKREGEDWIVLNSKTTTTPVIAVNTIPATFNGAARHNVSNAMHAIAAAHALGLKLENIRRALAGFEMGYDSLPGRLNVHFNGRFHIIMDYAHNADGLRQLVHFTDGFPCEGRKILRFGVSSNASEAACLGAAAIAAGHFDYYICAAKAGFEPGQGVDTKVVLQKGLLSAGIAEDCVEIFTDLERAVEYPVSLCQPGDLLVLVTPNVGLAPTWEEILKT